MNRSCRRFCLTILLLACGSAHAVGDDRSLDAASARSLMTSLIFRHNHDTPFIQRQVSPLFAGVSEQHGILRIEGDGRLVMRILSPRQEMRVIESGTVTMTRRRTDGRQSTLSTRLDPRSEPQLVLLAIEALLLGNLAFLDEHFLLGGTAQPSGWSIELQPRADAGSTLTRIVLLGSDHQLRRLRAEFAGAQRQRWLEMDIVAASEAPS
ncbi:MAG: hypothetical protein H6993_10805 [Pseudomonadales bacterium]|nr:hypothetical protein [Pseudomonadales bacterium]MCP5184445.1 hypothetical protein [Pseudomonadales bacterium]